MLTQDQINQAVSDAMPDVLAGLRKEISETALYHARDSVRAAVTKAVGEWVEAELVPAIRATLSAEKDGLIAIAPEIAAGITAELNKALLAAIGAGGVEPLRKTSADTSALRAALEEAEAALEVATSRLSARGANYPVHVTSEARALEIVRKALGESQADHFRHATKMPATQHD